MEIWTDWMGNINCILFCLIANNGNNGWLLYLIVNNSDWFRFILQHQTEIGADSLNWSSRATERCEKIL